jgi:hypothetical protein
MASKTTLIPDSSELIIPPESISPVDDVRKVREDLSARFGQDIDHLADHATVVAAPWREKLGLRSAPAIVDK